MTGGTENGGLTREVILRRVVDVLDDITSDWDNALAGPIGPHTGLVGDLEFESIDVVQFIVAIEEKFRRRGLPFEELLMKDGRYVDEIKVEASVDFLHRHLNGQ